MQIGIVYKGEKIKNEELEEANIPISRIGIRKYMIPDATILVNMKKKNLIVSEFIKYMQYRDSKGDISLGCPQQAYYDYNLNVYMHPSSLMSLVQGRMLHASLNPDKDTIKEMMINGEINTRLGKFFITGNIDFYNVGRGIVYELKTARELYGIPKISHIVQGTIYYTLLEINGYAPKEVNVVYLSHANYASFVFNENTIRKIRDNTILKHKPFEQIDNPYEAVGKVLQTEKGEYVLKPALWRCAYCPYRRYCPLSKKIMKEYLMSFSFLTKYGNISKYTVDKFVHNVKPSGVKEEDDFIMPEEELHDILQDILGSKFREFYEMVKEYRERYPSKFADMSSYVWW